MKLARQGKELSPLPQNFRRRKWIILATIALKVLSADILCLFKHSSVFWKFRLDFDPEAR
jgi:hypothetical protein